MVERIIYAKEKRKKETRVSCKYALEEVNRSDDNYPIVLEKLTFNVFSHYMSTKKSKKSGGYLSATSYGEVRSSLTHLYRISDKIMDGGFKNNYINSCQELKEFLRITRENPVIVLMRGIGQ